MPPITPVSSPPPSPIRAFAPSTYAGPVPEVRYAPEGDVVMLYGNNPEQITPRDLADRSRGGYALYSEGVGPGRYRNFFEHLNRTEAPVGFSVRVSNPGPTPIEIVVEGTGIARGLDGARAFRDDFNREGPTRTLRLAPREQADLLTVPAMAEPNVFFSGVVDFSVRGGTARVDDLAWTDARDIAPNPRYLGYVQRVEPDGTREARMYKGLSPHAAVTAPRVDYTFRDADSAGVLPVRHAVYDLEEQRYSDNTLDPQGWISNIGPAAEPRGVASDMLAFDMPGWGRVDAFAPTDGTGTYPNLGNWGAVYRLRGTLTNEGTRERRVRVNLRANARSGATVAFEGEDGKWRSRRIEPNELLTCREIRVPPGAAVDYTSAYVLGGPSGGALRQHLELLDTSP